MTDWATRGKWMDEHEVGVSTRDKLIYWNGPGGRRQITLIGEWLQDAIQDAMAECERLEDEAKKPKVGILAEAIRDTRRSSGTYDEIERRMRDAIKRQCDEWRKYRYPGDAFPLGSNELWSQGWNAALNMCIELLERGL